MRDVVARVEGGDCVGEGFERGDFDGGEDSMRGRGVLVTLLLSANWGVEWFSVQWGGKGS